jgi:hypothetical protein
MKKIYFVPLVLSILSAVSCNKGNNDLQPDYRIKQIMVTQDDIPVQKLEFTYDNEKVTEVDFYYKTEEDWAKDMISYFTYQGNQVTHERYYVKGGHYDYKSKNVFTIEDGRMVQDIFYAGSRNQWMLALQSDFNFENGRLTKWIRYKYRDEKWVENAGGNYTYIDNILQDYKGYEIFDGIPWIVDHDSFTWNNGKMVQYYDYNLYHNELILNAKSVYLYDNDQLNTIEIYAYRHDDWIPYLTLDFEYTPENLLLSLASSIGRKNTYVYEQGKGNFSQVYQKPTEGMYFWPAFKDSEGDSIEPDPLLPEEYTDYTLSALLY